MDRKNANTKIRFTKRALRNVFRWIALSILIGAIAGCVGTLFHLALNWSKNTFFANTWLIWLLPVGGVFIVLMYHTLAKDSVGGTDASITAVRDNSDVPIYATPMVFLATTVTHLLGGSSGREGAALQIGGSLASYFGSLLHLNRKERPIFVMCGMSAAFSAMFGTPVAAAVFVLEFGCVGILNAFAVTPCVVSSVTAYVVCRGFGIETERFSIVTPALGLTPILFAAALGLLCAFLSILWVKSLDWSKQGFRTLLPNQYLRVIVGSAILIALTYLVGSNHYNGAGMWALKDAIRGNAVWYDWVLKLLFTVVTLGCGFKGGEIVPTFYIGAMFGCVFGKLCGVDCGLAAALGACALFCGATNCPISSMLIVAELFGGDGLLLYCIACAVSFMFSGSFSLYHAQRMTHSKLFAEL